MGFSIMTDSLSYIGDDSFIPTSDLEAGEHHLESFNQDSDFGDVVGFLG